MRIFRSTISTLALCCATVSLAWAVSIYDVIELSRQGHSDEDIENIIRTTRSVFKLTAEDIPRLKDLGVSEVVIRAMLASVPAEPSGAESIRSDTINRERFPLANSAIADQPANGHAEEDAPARADSHSDAGSGDHGRAAVSAITPSRFSIQAVFEEAAGDHQHMYVTLRGVPILILRDEGRFQSVEDRGRAVMRSLEEAVRMGDGRFRKLHTDKADLVVYHSADLREVPIITVSRRDVYAYDVRSERRVTSHVLASYWAALLNDYWAITLQHRPPSRLVNLHRGGALKLLFEIVNPTDSDEQLDLGLAVQRLPAAIQSHLERLAAAVPDDFNALPDFIEDVS